VDQAKPGRNDAQSAQKTLEILDLDHLDRQTMGDRALAAEVLQLFTVQARSIAQSLAGPIDEADTRRLVHTLAGSARGIGAWQVADLASAAENAAVTGDFASLFEALHAVEVAIRAQTADP
jgi:HPt (histidine-containing phosphotransfer) domain-containing protein